MSHGHDALLLRAFKTVFLPSPATLAASITKVSYPTTPKHPSDSSSDEEVVTVPENSIVSSPVQVVDSIPITTNSLALPTMISPSENAVALPTSSPDTISLPQTEDEEEDRVPIVTASGLVVTYFPIPPDDISSASSPDVTMMIVVTTEHTTHTVRKKTGQNPNLKATKLHFETLLKCQVMQVVPRDKPLRSRPIGRCIVLLSTKRCGRVEARCVYNSKTQSQELLHLFRSPRLNKDTLKTTQAIASHRK